MEPLNVLAESDDWVAFDKPAGLVVHRSRGANDRHTLISVGRESHGPDLAPIHRLDRPTSGVILMAKNRDAARELSQAFADRQVRKVYEAVVRGWPLQPGDPPALIDRALGGKPASTQVRALALSTFPEPLGRYPTARFGLLELEPTTGLTHQLRRHLRGWGYPIVNDRKHGDDKLNTDFLARFGVRRLLLHARRLEFPFDGRVHTVEVAWNGRITGLIDYLGLRARSEVGPR